MKKNKLFMIFSFLMIGFFVHPLLLNSQTKNTPPKAAPLKAIPPKEATTLKETAKDDFPSNENLAQRNVGLLMECFAFTSGLRLNEQGKPNCNGIEIIEFIRPGERLGKHGSGFIVGNDGTIVTNYHVAAKSTGGRAKFKDGSTYEIRNIKVYDPVNDIAILKISGQRAFPKVELGDSDKAEPRDKVLAVGNPMGRGINITEGIVSQVVRDDYNKARMINHTATITSGNSGGALYKGDKVIGINVSVQVHPQFGGQTGFNQAVPINKAKELLQNPQYNRLIPIESAFPRSFELISQKAKQLDAVNGQVPASQGNIPGAWTTPYKTYALEDLLFFVRSPGRDLAITVLDAKGRPIGLGDLKRPDLEALFLTSDYPQDITIGVLNFDGEPANFGLQIFQIIW